MNPELLRLARQELTPLRLLGIPLIIGLVLLYGVFTSLTWRFDRGVDVLYLDLVQSCSWLLLGIVAFWGARRAADATASELRDRTWDTQRLSGVGPTSMTFGKLFGAPMGAWYAIVLLLTTEAVLATLINGRTTTQLIPFGYNFNWLSLAAQASGAFAVFAAALFASTTALAGQDRPRGFDTTFFQLAAVGAGVVATGWFGAAAGSKNQLALWGFEMRETAALTISFLFFGCWATVGVWTQMRKAFGAPISSLPWILFLGATIAFMSGWSGDAVLFPALLAASVAGYGAALIEPHRKLQWRFMARDLAAGKLGALLQAPAWIYAWLATVGVMIHQYPLFAELGEQLGLGGPQNSAVIVDGSPLDLTMAPAAFLLFMLRDMFICALAGFRARDGRGLWTALLALIILWFVIPGILTAATQDVLAAAVMVPLNGLSLISALLQAVVLGVAVIGLTMERKSRGGQ